MNGAASWEVGEVLSKGWDLTKSNIGLILGVTVVMGLIIGVVYGVFYGISMGIMIGLGDSSAGPLIGGVVMLLGMIAMLFAMMYFMMNYIRFMIKIVRGQGAAFGDLFAGTQGMFAAIGASLLIGIASALGSIIIVGGILVAIATFFTMYLIADKGLGPIDAIKESMNMAKGRWVEILIWLLVMAGVNFVGALVCGVGQLVTAPMTMFGSIIIYDRLSGGGGAAPGMPAGGGGGMQAGGGYPPQQQGGYPPQQQQQGGYPPQGGGYPPQGGGYPPQGGGYPPQGGGGGYGGGQGY